jgi:hypothetical protein
VGFSWVVVRVLGSLGYIWGWGFLGLFLGFGKVKDIFKVKHFLG